MLLNILIAISFSGMFYFLLTYLYARKELNEMNYVEIRNAEISEEVRRKSKESAKSIVTKTLNEVGYNGDLTPVLLIFSFLYLVIALVFKILGVKDVISLIISLPLSLIISYLTVLRYKTKQSLTFHRQLMQVLSLTIASLENSENPLNAFTRSSLTVSDPLRKEFQSALATMVSSEDTLSKALLPVSKKYPSRAFDLIMAALAIDDKVGAKLSQPLRQAQLTLERDFDLSAEADAEISQARSEFYSISVVIAIIAIMMVSGSQGSASKAYSSMLGIVMMTTLIGNYIFGVFRTLKIFNRAKRGY